MDSKVRYSIEEHCEFVHDSKTTYYYHGSMTMEDIDNSFQVYFLGFPDSPGEEVEQIFQRSTEVVHDRVLRPWFYCFDKTLGQFIICYDRFCGFLAEHTPHWLKHPQFASDIPVLPNIDLREELRELTKGVEYLHLNRVSHSALHCSHSYVWSDGMIKMVKVDDYIYDPFCWDESTERKKAASLGQWNQRRALHIDDWGKMIKEWLGSVPTWPERDSFLRSFRISVCRTLDQCLKKVYGHPFLMDDIKAIVQLLSDVQHAKTHKDGIHTKALSEAFVNKDLDTEFLKPGVGWRNPNMSSAFISCLQRVNNSPSTNTAPLARPPPQAFCQSKSPSSSALDQYTTTLISELLRFIRNIFEHYREYKLSISQVYWEINQNWPHFIDRVYELAGR